MENEALKEFIEKVKSEFQKAKKIMDDLTARVSALEGEISSLKEGAKKDDSWL